MFIKVKTNKFGIRKGEFRTAHGVLKTPFFMPDATRGFVKLSNISEVEKTGTQAMVVNTFHLYLQPGMEIIKQAGGLHRFMNWKHPLLSDSGGFQVFSLIHKGSGMGKITDEKAEFKSPLDGSRHELTPEKSIQIQFDLGVDMMVCLDDCPPNEFSRQDVEKAVDRTIAWAARCKAEYQRQLKKRRLSASKRPLLFGVIQGGIELDLRERCAKELVKIGFDGYGFGAKPVDKDGNFLGEVLEFTASIIPEKAIRFALGIGTPEDIVRCAMMGWDIFDCVIPTREGRHGRMFLSSEKTLDKEANKIYKNRRLSELKGKFNFYKTLNINNAVNRQDFSELNKDSQLPFLKNVSKAYLHHLFRLNEPLGQRLASLNNLEFYNKLMLKIRNLR